MTETPRMLVMISGGGTTLQNFIDLVDTGQLPVRIVGVISSREDAYGLIRAEKHGIPATLVARKEYATWDEFNRALCEAL
ncbi:MAG TPA: formyltransferase family protein, partial [bacterium]|nr:formyltransferase family protein [bacterium]